MMEDEVGATRDHAFPVAAPGPGAAVVSARRAERAAIDGLVQAAADGMSGALVLRGEPGIGKTALMDHAAAAASERGLRLARVAGVEAEMEMPYAGLHRLLGPILPRREHLPERQRAALDGAFGATAEAVADGFLVGLAALSLLSEAAQAGGPLVCLVDDAQWLDDESVAALAFVGRRLHADGIALLFAVRDPDPLGTRLDGIPDLPVPGLDLSDARKLLASSTTSDLAPEVADRILSSASGNPLAIAEFARHLTPEELGGLVGLPADLPLSRRLEATFLRQVRDLPADTQTLLLVAAAASSSEPGAVLQAAATLAAPGAGRTLGDADHLLVLRPTLAFRHPLIRSAVYQSASGAERRRAHGALAEVVDRRRDPDRWAWHRAAATVGRDDQVAADLEQGAERARLRGGPAAEAALLARSADLSTDGRQRAERLLAAADAALRAGGVDVAAEHLLRADDDLSDRHQRARADRLGGSLLLQRGEPVLGYEKLLDASAQFAPLDPAQRREALLEALDVLLIVRLSGLSISAEPLAAALHGPLDTSDDQDPSLSDLLLDGFVGRFATGYRAGAPSLRAAAERMRSGESDDVDASRCLLLGFFAALEVWDDQALDAWMERVIHVSREAGALHALRIAMLSAATTAVLFGDFDGAAAHHAEHDGLTSAIGGHVDLYRFHEAELTAWRGIEEDTRARCASITSFHDLDRDGPSLVHVAQNAMAVLHLGAGRYDGAVGELRGLYEADPPRFGTPSLPDMVEAGHRGGDAAFAAQALARLEERATASGTAWALGVLARSRALLAADDEAERWYRDAIDVLRATQAATDLARAHLLYGEWLRRQKRRTDARVELRLAHEAFAAMGADGFADRARVELAATGERARKRTVETFGQLTPQEHQVARLAADHATNREIASKLFISPSTVEYHLSNVYRKLGVQSRRELSRDLISTGRPELLPSER